MSELCLGLGRGALGRMEARQLLKLVEFATAHRTVLKTLIINLVRSPTHPTPLPKLDEKPSSSWVIACFFFCGLGCRRGQNKHL